MKDKKKNQENMSPEKALETLMKMASYGSFGSIFGGSGFDSFLGIPLEEPEKYPYERLGDGYELRPIKLTEKESKDDNVVRADYCHLYHNDLKVSDNIFRKGGTGGIFKDGYCQLIHYVRERKTTKYGTSYFSYGEHVIINHLGEVVLKGGNGDYPYHDGGHVGHLKNLYYDLRTGKPFMVKSSDSIDGKKTIIVNHRYDWYGKDLAIPIGIYLINKQTCEFEKIDECKR